MARGVNKAILVGNLGADPETRYTSNGTCVTNIRLATTEQWKDRQSGEQQERTEWHRVVLWGKLGEVAEQYLRKGAQVYIEGRIETRKWQDQGGQDRYTTEVRALDMQMLGGRGGGGGGGGGGPGAEENWSQDTPASAPRQSSRPAQQPPPPPDDLDDDIPF